MACESERRLTRKDFEIEQLDDVEQMFCSSSVTDLMTPKRSLFSEQFSGLWLISPESYKIAFMMFIRRFEPFRVDDDDDVEHVITSESSRPSMRHVHMVM